MVDERTFEGETLRAALDAAAAKLGVPEPELAYEILQTGRRGLFGIGARNVRLRILPPLEEEPRADRARPSRRSARAPAPARTPPVAAGAGTAAGTAAATGSPEATLERMLELMALRVELRREESDQGLVLSLRGQDVKKLKQKDGELISALQFVLNRMARRAWPETGRIRLKVDVEQAPRTGRDDEVVELTREVAQQVSRTGRAKKLLPMNAYERRLVHLTTREFRDVGSRSEGRGPLKAVRIFKQGGPDPAAARRGS